MKFVKRISLFFIYPLSMFSIGFISNMSIMEYFYPSDIDKYTQPEIVAEDIINEPIAVSVTEEPIVTANTKYILQEYNLLDSQLTEAEEKAPDKYIGLSRDKLVDEIDNYNQNPSLSDQEKGFSYMELISFASGRIVVRKSYELKEETKGFFLLNENHYVVVYDQSLSHVYMNTNILVESLSEKLQKEIINMKYVETEGELFNFLESYSS